GRGLADRAGDRDHLALQARARGASEIAQAFQHVVDDQERRIGGELVALDAFDHRQRGPGLQRGDDEIVAVMDVALDGEVGLARLNGSAVDGEPDDPVRQRAVGGGAHRVRHCFRCPEQDRAHATLEVSTAATASWSLNGRVLSPTIWPVSWPLPAIKSASPGCNSSIAKRIACARSPISRAPFAASRIAARIASGFSLRGLSSVTIT